MPVQNPYDFFVDADPRRGSMHPDGYWTEYEVQEFTIDTSGLTVPVEDPVGGGITTRLYGATEEAIPGPEYLGIGLVNNMPNGYHRQYTDVTGAGYDGHSFHTDIEGLRGYSGFNGQIEPALAIPGKPGDPITITALLFRGYRTTISGSPAQQQGIGPNGDNRNPILEPIDLSSRITVTSTTTLSMPNKLFGSGLTSDACQWTVGGSQTIPDDTYYLTPVVPATTGPFTANLGYTSLERHNSKAPINTPFNVGFPCPIPNNGDVAVWSYYIRSNYLGVWTYFRFRPKGTFIDCPRTSFPTSVNPILSIYGGGNLQGTVELERQTQDESWWAGKLSDGRRVGVYFSNSVLAGGPGVNPHPGTFVIGTNVGDLFYSPSSHPLNSKYVRYPLSCYVDSKTQSFMGAIECHYRDPFHATFAHIGFDSPTGSTEDVVVKCPVAGGTAIHPDVSFIRPAIASSAPYVAGNIGPVNNFAPLTHVRNRVVQVDSYSSDRQAGPPPVLLLDRRFCMTDDFGWFDSSIVVKTGYAGTTPETKLITLPGETYVGGLSKVTSKELFAKSSYDTNNAGFGITAVGSNPPPSPVADFTGTPLVIGVGDTVTFTDASTDANIWVYRFGDGVGSNSTLQNPTHVYTFPGKYTVSQTVANATGFNTKTRTDYVVVNTDPPTADFTGTPTVGTAPLNVTFTDLSSKYITGWEWSFGSTVQNPVQSFGEGLHTVSLKATNFGGSNTKTRTNYIDVYEPPVANFTATPLTGTAPLTVTFTDTSTHRPVDYVWDFGDGGFSSAANPTYEYTAAGTYSVELTVSNPAGSDTKNRTDYVVVTAPPPPVAGFSADVTTGAAPLTVTFTDSSTNSPTSWSWDFGDGGSDSVQNPVYEYATAGTYTVTLTSTNAGGSDGEVKTDYIVVT